MAILYFRVSAQYDEVIRLRNEISKLEAQIKEDGRKQIPPQQPRHWKLNWHPPVSR